MWWFRFFDAHAALSLTVIHSRIKLLRLKPILHPFLLQSGSTKQRKNPDYFCEPFIYEITLTYTDHGQGRVDAQRWQNNIAVWASELSHVPEELKTNVWWGARRRAPTAGTAGLCALTCAVCCHEHFVSIQIIIHDRRLILWMLMYLMIIYLDLNVLLI